MPNLFDLHCDTLPKVYKAKQNIETCDFCVSLEKFSCFDKKAQVFAIFSQEDLTDDEAFLRFKHISLEFKSQLEENGDKILLCTKKEHLAQGVNENKLCALLAVEDARLLGGDISRLETLFNEGVRVLTLGWQGETCIGGAYDTETGLSDFGVEVLKECENLGIIIDVSHLSEKGFWDVASKATRPFIASHSDSAFLCNHRRNLSDIQYRTIATSGGIVGVNLVAEHLTKAPFGEFSVYEEVCSHIEHFYSIDQNAVCVGFDFDGTKPLMGLEDVSKTPMLYEALTNRGLDEKDANNVFFGNAYRFFSQNLPD